MFQEDMAAGSKTLEYKVLCPENKRVEAFKKVCSLSAQLDPYCWY